MTLDITKIFKIDKILEKKLKHKSFKLGISEAEIVRRALEIYFRDSEVK